MLNGFVPAAPTRSSSASRLCATATSRKRSPSCCRSLRLLDRRADQVAVLGPAPVVVPHVVQAEEILQHEPRVARPLTNAAISDRLLRWVDALLIDVNCAQFVGGFERAIRRDRGAPR